MRTHAEKLLVLTFDDAVSNHATFAAPLLREYGFGATFFVCEFPPDFATNQEQYMTWQQIRMLHDLGFEIGNHTLRHRAVTNLTIPELEEELDALDRRCAEYGIPRPDTFCYPGGPFSPEAASLLASRGYLFARTCQERPYLPQTDNPLLLPAFPVHGDDPAVFHRALESAATGGIPVLVFHGLPEYTHPWVSTPPERFREYLAFLAAEGYTVLSLRELAERVGPKKNQPDV